MAKITAYKFVNPGLSAKGSPTVAAANKTTLAVNRLGVTVESVSKTIADIATASTLKGKLEEKQVINERRQARLEKDQEAEAAKEYTQKDKKKDEGTLKRASKKIGKGVFGWLENFLGPIGSLLLSLGGFALTNETLKYLSDEENKEKIITFLERTEFVFNKLKEFAENIGSAIGEGLDFIFGKETTIEERLDAFGKIALAIGGIAGMITAAGGIRDLLDAGDALPDGPDGGRRPQGDGPDRPRKPTPTNPSGADPNTRGPRNRPSAPDIKATYGDAAEKAYKKVLSERGDDAARAFANALEESGGSVTKAQQKFNRFVKKGRFPKIEPPRPNALQRIGNFFGGITDSAVKQGTRLRNFAVDQGGRLIKSLQGLPGWAVNQYNNLSTAARKKWDDVSKVGQMIAEKGNKWASAAGNKLKAAGNWVVDGGKKAFNNLASGAKNFFLEKIMTPLKPIIEPIAKKAKQIGQGLFDMLMKIPGADKILEVLKKKGINSMGDVAQAGSKLGKRAAAVLPVIGGIVNLAFAYDRAANGDSIGALIEGTSGILDIAGLATAGAGSGVSMLLDGYMFARDFIPQLQQGEEAVVDAVGARGLKDGIDNILSKLPNIGEIINMFMGKSKEEATEPRDGEGAQQSLFLGGVVKNIGKAVSGVGNAIKGVVSNPIVQTAASFIPGAAPIMAGINMGMGLLSGNPMQMLSSAAGMIPGLGGALGGFGNAITSALNSPLGQIGQSFLSGGLSGAIQSGLGYAGSALGLPSGLVGIAKAALGGGDMYEGIRETAVQAGVDPKIIGVADAGRTALSQGGLSEKYVMQEAIEFLPVPIVMTQLKLVPQAVPINNSSSNVVPGGPSSLTQRMQ